MDKSSQAQIPLGDQPRMCERLLPYGRVTGTDGHAA